MPDPETPSYEIDHGEPEAAASAASAPRPDLLPADEAAEDARLRALFPAARAHVEAAGQTRRVIDMKSLILVGLCGQGLAGAASFDSELWNFGATLGMLATLAGLGCAGAMWWRTRQPSLTLEAMPVPMEDPPGKAGTRDAEQRAAARRRREGDITNIELQATDLVLCRSRLHLAILGALVGSICGWVIGFHQSPGVATLAASAAALPGAILGWKIAGGGWPEARILQAVLAGLPGAALLLTLLATTPLGWRQALTAVIGCAVVVGAGLAGRKRLLAIASPGHAAPGV